MDKNKTMIFFLLGVILFSTYNELITEEFSSLKDVQLYKIRGISNGN